MENRDARTLNPDAQEELRRQAIRLLKKGQTQQEVADQCDVSRRAVGKWWAAYREGGWKALVKQRRGRKRGEGARLTAEQEREIQKVISDKTPDQLKMKFALWSREAVQTLIFERFKVVFSRQHVGNLLKRWGFTPQRPLKKAYEQRPEEVNR
jgi:transposase